MVALVVGGERVRNAYVLLEVTVALAVGGRSAKEGDIDAEGIASIDRGSRAVVDSHFLSPEKAGKRLKPILYLAIHSNAGCIEHKRHLVIAETRPPRPCEVEVPSRRIDRVGPCHYRQCEREIVATAPEWPDDVDVDRRLLPRKGLPVTRDDAPGRFVPIHAAKVCRVANRRANVTASFEPGEACGKRSRRSAR